MRAHWLILDQERLGLVVPSSIGIEEVILERLIPELLRFKASGIDLNKGFQRITRL